MATHKKIRKEFLGECLAAIIDRKSPVILGKDPLWVYYELEKMKANPYESRLILFSLLAGVSEKLMEENATKEDVAKFLGRECGLASSVASDLSEAYTTLFEEKKEQWKQRNGKGFRELCSREIDIEGDFQSFWHRDDGRVECTFHSNVKVKVADKELVGTFLREILEDHPFYGADVLEMILKDKFQDYTQEAFDRYCDDDDYYPPCAEDFDDNFEHDILPSFFEENGFEIIDWGCEGMTGDYERDSW